MPQNKPDPGTITWDAPPETVPPQQGSRQGGVIITDPTVASGEAREQARLGLETERVGIAQQREQREQQKFEEEQAKGDVTPPRDVSDVRAELMNVIDKAKRAKELSNKFFATGFGAETSRDMGGTAAADVAALLDTIGSSVAFDRLSRMRAESPTGGALGNVTERELDLLKSTIASLNQSQSDEQFRSAMDDVIAAYERVLAKIPGESPPRQSPLAPTGEGDGPVVTHWTDENGEPVFDENGAPLPREGGGGYDAQGNYLGLFGRVTYEGPPQEEMGVVEGAVETVTGSERSTPEIEALPDWTDMPLTEGLLDDPLKMAQVAASTMMTGPEETARIIQSNFPDVVVRQDAKGNFILRSPVDGKEYAIKPGFRGSDVPRAAGAILAFTPAGRATSISGAAAASAATQAGIEALEAGSGGTFDPENVVAAGAGGAAGQQLSRAATTIKQARAALPKKAAGRTIADAEAVIEAGSRESVPVLTSDVRPPKTWFGRWLQQTGEKLPIVGTAEVRAKQQAAREAMIEGLYDQYSANPALIDDVTADFISTRKGRIGKLTEQKKEVFSSLSGAPPPASKNAIDTINRALGEFGEKESFRPLAAKLRGWKSDLQNARSVADVENVRKSIGDTFNDTSMESVSTAMRGITNGPQGLYNALRTDMGDYISENAGKGAFSKWKSANEELSDFADDLGKSTLDRLLRTGEATPEDASRILFSQKPSDVRALMRNLSAKGQDRARSLVVQDIIEKAGGINELSTAKFTTALKKSANTHGVIFPKADVDRFAGMLRLMQATRRAEQAGLATPTGQSLLPFAGASGLGWLGGGWAGAAGMGAASATGFRMFESKAMRNLLVSLSRTKPYSAAEKNVLKNIANVAIKSGAAPAAATQTRPEQQPTSTIEVR